MRRISGRSISLVVSAATAVLLALPAVAGTKESHAVDLSLESMNAMGDLGAARNSRDPNQFIGCSIIAVKGQPTYAMCAARDFRGQIASCTTMDPSLIQAVSYLNGDSFLQFSWNAEMECTVVVVYQSSMFQPKR